MRADGVAAVIDGKAAECERRCGATGHCVTGVGMHDAQRVDSGGRSERHDGVVCDRRAERGVGSGVGHGTAAPVGGGGEIAGCRMSPEGGGVAGIGVDCQHDVVACAVERVGEPFNRIADRECVRIGGKAGGREKEIRAGLRKRQVGTGIHRFDGHVGQDQRVGDHGVVGSGELKGEIGAVGGQRVKRSGCGGTG